MHRTGSGEMGLERSLLFTGEEEEAKGRGTGLSQVQTAAGDQARGDQSPHCAPIYGPPAGGEKGEVDTRGADWVG